MVYACWPVPEVLSGPLEDITVCAVPAKGQQRSENISQSATDITRAGYSLVETNSGQHVFIYGVYGVYLWCFIYGLRLLVDVHLLAIK